MELFAARHKKKMELFAARHEKIYISPTGVQQYFWILYFVIFLEFLVFFFPLQQEF